ncbi:MAG: hypothetical protein ACOCQ4_03610 [bacterium]
MYTSYIGKKFLELYNKKNSTSYSAEQFFTEVQFPLFFDDNKHLMHVHGSTFFQPIKNEDIKQSGSESVARLRRLQKDIKENKISGSTYSGYAAGGVDAVTSGQVTSLDKEIDKEEVYASWIGQGFVIGFKGGLFLIDEESLYWRIFSGWEIYRKYLNQTPNLKGRQIETWNGNWLMFCSKYNSIRKIDIDAFQLNVDSETNGVIAIPTLSWFKIMTALTKTLDAKEIVANAFVFSKVNSSFGFINLILPQIKKIYELRDELFLPENSTILEDEDIEELSTYYNFKEACKQGVIGLKAIEPAQLRQFMPSGSVQYAQGKNFFLTDKKSYKQYQLFKIWIIAMLNKTELMELASSLAQSLIDFESKDDRGKKVFSSLSKDVLEAKNLKTFIDKLTEILSHTPEVGQDFKCLVEAVLKMPNDSFPLFITLVKFEYTLKKSNQ